MNTKEREKNLRVIVGEAGTGKTHKALELARELDIFGYKGLILAKQGKTLKALKKKGAFLSNATFMTLDLALRNYTIKYDKNNVELFQSTSKPLSWFEQFDYILLDEYGLCAAEDVDYMSNTLLDKTLRVKHMFITGDIFQLRVVGSEASSIKPTDILTENFRANKKLLELQKHILAGKPFETSNVNKINLLDEFIDSFVANENEDKVIICNTNADCDYINSILKDKIELNKVMCLRNVYGYVEGKDEKINKEFEFINGGEYYLNGANAVISETGKIHRFNNEQMKEYFTYPWAITAHKSQGLEFTEVYYYMSNEMTIAHRYTTISRAREDAYWYGVKYASNVQKTLTIEDVIQSSPGATTQDMAYVLGMTTRSFNKYVRESDKYELIAYRDEKKSNLFKVKTKRLKIEI